MKNKIIHLSLICIVALTSLNLQAQSRKEEKLLKAARSSSIRDVEKLIKGGINVNSFDEDKWTSLHFASRCQENEMVKTLLQAGADVNLVNTDGYTSLDYEKEKMTVLLNHGANYNKYASASTLFSTNANKNNSPPKSTLQKKSYFHEGTHVATTKNVGFIIDWEYTKRRHGYDAVNDGFVAHGIIENQNSKAVSVYRASFKFNYIYNHILPSGKISEKSRNKAMSFPQVFLLKPGSYIQGRTFRKSFEKEKYSDLSVNPNVFKALGTVRVINELTKTSEMKAVTAQPQTLLSLDGVAIEVYIETKFVDRLKGSDSFYKYIPVVTVKNSTSEKVKLKGSISFRIHYGGFSESYSISLGRVKPGETDINKGLGDRSPAMNFKPDIYIDKIELPKIKF